MPNYPIPPWISNVPDPVQAYSHGIQIGSQIGEDQARQQLQQDNMLLQAHKDQVEQEVEKAKFQLVSDTAAKKYAAQQKFTQLVQSGMDPAQAMLQVPIIADEVAPAVRAMKSGQMTPYQQQELDIRNRELEQKSTGKEYGDIQTVDLGDGWRAAFRPGSPGMHLMNPHKDAEISPTAAANLLKTIPEIDAVAGTAGTTNSLSATLVPMLTEKLKSSLMKKQKEQGVKKIGRFTIIPKSVAPADSTSPDDEETD